MKKILSWLCRKGEETLSRYHVTLADSLAAAKSQQREFQRFLILAQQFLRGTYYDSLLPGIFGGLDRCQHQEKEKKKKKEEVVNYDRDESTALSKGLHAFFDRMRNNRENLCKTHRVIRLRVESRSTSSLLQILYTKSVSVASAQGWLAYRHGKQPSRKRELIKSRARRSSSSTTPPPQRSFGRRSFDDYTFHIPSPGGFRFVSTVASTDAADASHPN
ncbi:hypothetical protein DAPPUDRAFT_255915 [Daphnia pulex]|uniref:Uncharacterized protein n=1 Tax=Daphnia pulex TaxID=6669 RepID=E9HAC3_DAPPU|nr:hypothetical protein DAPPUDRAFT_255915 [Daphnia pulex]|eukprot:EFX71281.1 hypothetical protein DAPPUDRAFT_255915 [Daphnia pulex]